MSSRRNFLQTSALGLAGTLALPTIASAAEGKRTTNLVMGMAGYTFAKFDVPASIAIMQRVGIKYISVKDFHLPLNADAAKIESVKQQFSAAGITIYAVGVIYMKSKEAIDEAFAYAQRAGVPMIVGVPNPELIDYTEEVVKNTNVKLAIHNHGPEDKLYPGPKSAYDLIKNRDARLGICIDIGHSTRAGEDPVEAVKKYKDRLFDMHIKDIVSTAKDAKVIEVGRGVINFPALIKALNKVGFTGYCSLEYEKDMSDPLAGIAESIGYFKGTADTLQ
jgi:inosose dehydratase